MDEKQDFTRRPVNPRRKQRTQMQIFKEAYLPAIVACVALLLIVVFIIGSISRGIQRKEFEEQQSLEASISASEAMERLTKEADERMQQAQALARHFDYDGALAILDGFSGNIQEFSQLSQLRTSYTQAKGNMVLWEDVNDVLNLSFQMLIADPARAFRDTTYGTAYNRNFVTVEEFKKILNQLYENDYILISMSDILSGTEIQKLYLPSGKKPLILTQTQVNYYTYMTDSDGDKRPDKGGDGFAGKLVLDDNGRLTCEFVDTSGQLQTGDYDLVPILESFIADHPDFSYKGAKAILAVTGYDGLFGYRTNASAKSFFGETAYNEEVSGATQIVKALRDAGYEIACYTYKNIAYGTSNSTKIQQDLDKWVEEVEPILGNVDTFVFAKDSDISNTTASYSGDKFDLLNSYGFTYYLGFCNAGIPWFAAQNDHVRQGRILVSGTNLAHHADWFNGIFDAASVLDTTRGTIPA
ncbi:MAG: hypothetical protein IKC95_02090 [Oscillospiraceae bacterium]|nr:hypothetical protein [Oscillospiraceae bacterium]